jgi:flavin prenyltransferase
MTRKVVIGVSGASGAPYAERLLRWLSENPHDLEPHVVFSRYGRLVWNDEVGVDPESFGFPMYGPGDMTAPFASGSAGFEAMVVVPCSAGSLGRIAHGLSADLIGRAADVMLKEQRRLLLVVRETPYSLVMLRNMVAVAEAGAMVMPASPSFYSAPSGIPQLLDTVVSRILDRLGVSNAAMRPWNGEMQGHLAPRGER